MAARTGKAFALGAALAALLAIGASPAEAKLKLKSIGRFAQPTYVTQAPGRPGLLVVEKAGRVISVQGKRRSVFLDIRGLVRAEGEEGLLSIAFPDDFASTRLFYAYFTVPSADNVVAEFRASGNAADPA